MEVITSKYSGYCFGVKRALKITEEILKKNKIFYAWISHS